MTPERYSEVRISVEAAGFGDEIAWSEELSPPKTPEAFAREAIWVILCSGMKATIARQIQRRVSDAIDAGDPVGSVFGHRGKASAIDHIWAERRQLFADFQKSDDAVEFCLSLPWIGPITKWHLAKNLGADVAKPDRHLVRIAQHFGTTPAALCVGLAAATGDRVATVDYVLWRAAERGMLPEASRRPR